MFKKRKQSQYPPWYFIDCIIFFCSLLHCRNPLREKSFFQSTDCGYHFGKLYANSLRNKLPETWVPGIKFCTKQVLRAGIVLYGFRLTLTQVAAVGLPAVVIDTIIVAGTISWASGWAN